MGLLLFFYKMCMRPWIRSLGHSDHAPRIPADPLTRSVGLRSATNSRDAPMSSLQGADPWDPMGPIKTPPPRDPRDPREGWAGPKGPWWPKGPRGPKGPKGAFGALWGGWAHGALWVIPKLFGWKVTSSGHLIEPKLEKRLFSISDWFQKSFVLSI